MGWVFQYALTGKDQSLADLRSVQDWYVRYQLTKAGGVAEVASVGGFVKEYQVIVDPHRLASYGVPLARLSQVIRESNRDVGGRVVELAEKEFMVRGLGYLKGSRTSKPWCSRPMAARRCWSATWRGSSWCRRGGAASPN